MTRHIVVVAGNLGTGKTALVERVGRCLDWHVVYESVIDNPYLTDFYTDMTTWSFHLQIFFLGHRARQHLKVARMHRPAILDRSIYEDARVFAKALHHLGNITERDYVTYLQVFDVVVSALPPPDLLIYLRAPVGVLFKRIQERGLEFDYRGITEEYLALLDSFYEAWMQDFDLCPVLSINTENCDYVNDTQCLEVVTNRILQKLGKT